LLKTMQVGIKCTIWLLEIPQWERGRGVLHTTSSNISENNKLLCKCWRW
jgi:hypothetical protein